MKKLVTLLVLVLLTTFGCKTTSPSRPTYVQPEDGVPSAVFIGEDCPQKIFVKGHEYIYLCKVGEQYQGKESFNTETRVALGTVDLSICYLEGGNFTEAPFQLTLEKETVYQIKLGERVTGVVNFSVVDTETGEFFLGPIAVPKGSLFSPTLIY